MDSIPKVPVGPTTVLGVGTGVSALVAAVVAFIAGDRSEQTVGTIVGGVVGGALLGITFLGRYAQAWLTTRYHLQLQVAREAGVEPGDLITGLPHLPVADPADIPIDQSDSRSADPVPPEPDPPTPTPVAAQPPVEAPA